MVHHRHDRGRGRGCDRGRDHYTNKSPKGDPNPNPSESCLEIVVLGLLIPLLRNGGKLARIIKISPLSYYGCAIYSYTFFVD